MLTLKVEEVALPSSVGLPLAHDNSWYDLLSQFWLSSLDRGQEELADGTSWQSIQS